jgi:uncharacterized membrane protein
MPADDSSDADRIDDLASRIDRLERTVADLRDAVEALPQEPDSPRPAGEAEADGSDAPSASSRTPPDSSAEASPSRATTASSALGDRLQRYATVLGLRSEDWISYVGVGLLLFGLAFLFEYSIDQGWLTPAVRVGVGVFIGAAMLAAGVRRGPDRPLLQQILFGGSSAAFYGSIFAAYQLYGLLPYPLASGSMVFVTVATIAMAIQADHASTALIGTAGGLGTPFLLYSDAGGGAGLTLYTCVVLAGACAIYLYRGWRSLLYLALVGGWLVLLGPPLNTSIGGAGPDPIWGIQGSLVAAWLLLGGTPVLRAHLRRHAPSRWPALSPPRWPWLARLTGPHPTGPVIVSPLLAIAATRLLWPGAPAGTWTVVAGVGAAGYGALYWGLRRLSVPHYAPVHGLVAAVLLAYGLSDGLGAPALLGAWAVEAVLLLALGRRLDDRLLRGAGHALFVGVALWMAERLAPPLPDARLPLLNVPALVELGVLGTGLGAARLSATAWMRWGYRGAVLAGWLGWTATQLGALPHGPAYVSVAWGGTAAALLLGGAWWRAPRGQKAGLAVLLLFVGKLFFVDLAALSLLGRIVLFLGTGAGFLLISYLLPGIGGRAAQEKSD